MEEAKFNPDPSYRLSGHNAPLKTMIAEPNSRRRLDEVSASDRINALRGLDLDRGGEAGPAGG